MAIDASEIFVRHRAAHRMSPEAACKALSVATYVRTSEDSKAIDRRNHMPKVIISASGMATGGRVLHHLKSYAPDPRSTILFAGFQAGGTRGADMIAGAPFVKIHGEQIPVRASVIHLDSLSAHADSDGILAWLRNFEKPPRLTFITHGEPAASDALRRRVTDELGWNCVVPEYRDEITLAA
jgi:metallo-beta-lactamase family protein